MDQKKKEKLSPCMVGFIRDQTLSGCTYQEVKEVVGCKYRKLCNDERKNLALYALRSNEKLTIAATAELKLKKFIK